MAIINSIETSYRVSTRRSRRSLVSFARRRRVYSSILPLPRNRRISNRHVSYPSPINELANSSPHLEFTWNGGESVERGIYPSPPPPGKLIYNFPSNARFLSDQRADKVTAGICNWMTWEETRASTSVVRALEIGGEAGGGVTRPSVICRWMMRYDSIRNIGGLESRG